jgi:uncharacterized cupredoxin-like copper-binding protein
VAAVAALALALATVVAAACGGGDDDGGDLAAGTSEASGPDGVRTVEVAMEDNVFSPAEVEVTADETVRFVFANEGAVTHDAVIGDEAAQAEHEDEMRADDSMDGMDHGAEAEGEEGAITVEPGGTGELTHTFAAGDELLIGCHEPGHYDAGMRIRVAVSEA